jgi:transposase
MERFLTETEWQAIAPLIPAPGRMGRPRADDRRVVAAILWVARHRAPWSALPRRYGNHVTAWRRHREWTATGVWPRLVAALRDPAPSGPFEGPDAGPSRGIAELSGSSPDWASLDAFEGLGA